MDAFEPLKRLANPDNLVDRITEAEKANLVQPTQFGDSLEEMSGNTGDLIVGNLISPAPEVEVMDVTSTDFTGSFMSGVGATFGSDVYNIGGVSAGVLQFGLSQADGKAYAGAGAVTLSENGIQIEPDSTESTLRSYKFVDSSGTVLSYLAGSVYISGGDFNALYIRAKDITAKNSLISIKSTAPSGMAARVSIVADDVDTSQSIDIDTSDDSMDIIAGTLDITADAINILSISNPVDISGGINADDLTLTGFLNLQSGGTLTISSGAITAAASRHAVDTQGGAATDDLDTISGGADGDILVIYTANSARDVTAKDGTGNLALAGDFVMDNIRDRLTLMKESGTWVELCRSNNQ